LIGALAVAKIPSVIPLTVQIPGVVSVAAKVPSVIPLAIQIAGVISLPVQVPGVVAVILGCLPHG
jgi:hypothetical protein